jgi:hypothetical protein
MGAVFFITALTFSVYVRNVHVRQQVMVKKAAARTKAIVSSLFPSHVRERLLEDVGNDIEGNDGTPKLKSYLDNQAANAGAYGPAKFQSKPIADLFPACTVMFAE